MASQTNLTLNQIIKEFRYFSEAHDMLNDFGFAYRGNFADYASTRKFTYPIFLTTISGESYPENSIEYQMKAYFADLAADNEEDVLEVISNISMIIADFIAWLREEHEEIDIQINSSVQPAIQQTSDGDIGFILDYTIVLPYYANPCAIPRTED